jgi:multiple sugar transport system substrate-binding protein
MFCISQDSQYPEEAAKFLNYFWTSEEANKILAGERGMSIFSNVTDALAPELTAEQVAANEFVNLVGSFEVGETNPVSPEPYQAITDYYNLTIQKVIYGELTPDEGAKGFYDFASSQFK